jgi:hypothetical protein
LAPASTSTASVALCEIPEICTICQPLRRKGFFVCIIQVRNDWLNWHHVAMSVLELETAYSPRFPQFRMLRASLWLRVMDDEDRKAWKLLFEKVNEMQHWTKIDDSRRHAEYCDAHGFRCVVEASRWSPHPLQRDQRDQRDEWEGFVNAIRVGAWHDLEMAKRETISLAALRMAENNPNRPQRALHS